MSAGNVTVVDDDAGIRLDRWFRRHYPQLNHARLQRLLRTGQIRVDGGRVRSSTRLAAGQLVRVPPQVANATGRGVRSPPSVSAEDRVWIRSLVLHEDEAVIALNKPAGIPVQGGVRAARNLDRLLPALVEPGKERPRLVHRLDRDTSGVLLVARSASAAAALADAFRGRDVSKIYWALVAGVPDPEEGVIDLPLGKRAVGHDFELVVPDRQDGRAAVTAYRVIETIGHRIAWLALVPRTGRTHQLRAHCTALGTPIIGDRKYGHGQGDLPVAQGLHLHARALSFIHPSGGRITVAAPLSPHMAESWRILGLDAEAG